MYFGYDKRSQKEMEEWQNEFPQTTIQKHLLTIYYVSGMVLIAGAIT